MTPLIDLAGVTKRYGGARPFTALDDVHLAIPAGGLTALVGRSGSGKTTLLNLAAGLDRPTAGDVTVGGTKLSGMSEDALARWRGRHVGVVFQFFQLMPTLTVAENVMLAMDFVDAVPRGERRARALAALALVEVADQADKLPAALSGGQQQRVAIARALANDPPLLLADEPTGNLDSATADAVLGLFDRLVAAGKTLVVVTHDEEVAARAGRVVRLADGRVLYDVAAEGVGR